MSNENNWTTRVQAYDVIYRYPGAFGITQFTWGPGLWYIIARNVVNGVVLYTIHGSDCLIEIDPNDLQSVKCFDTLYGQMTGNPTSDISQYIEFSDLSPIPE